MRIDETLLSFFHCPNITILNGLAVKSGCRCRAIRESQISAYKRKGVQFLSYLTNIDSPCLREWDIRVRNETIKDGGHSEMNLFMGCEPGGGGVSVLFFGMFVV